MPPVSVALSEFTGEESSGTRSLTAVVHYQYSKSDAKAPRSLLGSVKMLLKREKYRLLERKRCWHESQQR